MKRSVTLSHYFSLMSNFFQNYPPLPPSHSSTGLPSSCSNFNIGSPCKTVFLRISCNYFVGTLITLRKQLWVLIKFYFWICEFMLVVVLYLLNYLITVEFVSITIKYNFTHSNAASFVNRTVFHCLLDFVLLAFYRLLI